MTVHHGAKAKKKQSRKRLRYLTGSSTAWQIEFVSEEEGESKQQPSPEELNRGEKEKEITAVC